MKSARNNLYQRGLIGRYPDLVRCRAASNHILDGHFPCRFLVIHHAADRPGLPGPSVFLGVFSACDWIERVRRLPGPFLTMEQLGRFI